MSALVASLCHAAVWRPETRRPNPHLHRPELRHCVGFHCCVMTDEWDVRRGEPREGGRVRVYVDSGERGLVLYNLDQRLPFIRSSLDLIQTIRLPRYRQTTLFTNCDDESFTNWSSHHLNTSFKAYWFWYALETGPLNRAMKSP
jgi:hypothetical protein